VTPAAAETATSQAGAEAESAPAPKAKARPIFSGDLSAMRELANLSTKAALETHERKRRQNMIYSKAAVAMTALATGFYLMLASPRGGAAWYGGAIALLVSVFWALQLAVVTGYIHIQSSGGLVLDLWKRLSQHGESAGPGPGTEPYHGPNSTRVEIAAAICVDQATTLESTADTSPTA
jgi:hypothetical protein